MAKVRLLPSESRRRGLPAVGFDLVIAEGVVADSPPAGVHAVLTERRTDGRRVGSLWIEVATAALIIDRDGALEQLVTARAPGAVPYAVELEAGAHGFRADTVRADGGELPYRSWFALAPTAVIGGGAVIVTVEAAALHWPAATAMLASLRVFGRDGDARAITDVAAVGLDLPLIKPSGS